MAQQVVAFADRLTRLATVRPACAPCATCCSACCRACRASAAGWRGDSQDWSIAELGCSATNWSQPFIASSCNAAFGVDQQLSQVPPTHARVVGGGVRLELLSADQICASSNHLIKLMKLVDALRDVA